MPVEYCRVCGQETYPEYKESDRIGSENNCPNCGQDTDK